MKNVSCLFLSAQLLYKLEVNVSSPKKCSVFPAEFNANLRVPKTHMYLVRFSILFEGTSKGCMICENLGRCNDRIPNIQKVFSRSLQNLTGTLKELQRNFILAGPSRI